MSRETESLAWHEACLFSMRKSLANMEWDLAERAATADKLRRNCVLLETAIAKAKSEGQTRFVSPL